MTKLIELIDNFDLQKKLKKKIKVYIGVWLSLN